VNKWYVIYASTEQQGINQSSQYYISNMDCEESPYHASSSLLTNAVLYLELHGLPSRLDNLNSTFTHTHDKHG